MLGISYDEDLINNAFFQTLKKDFSDIFFNSIAEGCIICVPRAGVIPIYTITIDDILGHILVPSDELPESHFQTLSGRDVKISNRVVTVEYDLGYQFSTHILFEETYYTEELLKYKILCIEHPLEPKSEGQADGVFDIRTLRDCMDILWIESSNKDIVEHLDKAIEHFINHNIALEDASLQTLKDLTGALYAKCLQTVFKDVRLRDKASNNLHTLKNLKLAVETYMLHGIYSKLFKHISACTSHEDSKLNKTVRNSTDLQLRDMDIREDLLDTIPQARLELCKIDGYSTVLGKIGCLKKMMNAISKDANGGMLSADDLLPLIIFIVIKTNISNWFAHLVFLKQFHFSAHSGQGTDEDEFLVTTLEAAIEHIKSGAFLGPSSPEGQALSSTSSEDLLNDSKEDLTTMSYLLQEVSRGNLDEVKIILEKHKVVVDYSTLDLCHPLCMCEKCAKTVSKNSRNTNPTVYSCDDGGLTALHVAAMYGKPVLVDYLLSMGADVSATDLNGYTPLHYAALRGHQSALLMLAQSNSDINAPDNSLNTPLHLSCVNGHEACVKALIYHCEYMGRCLYINAQNMNGDTPLHFATKWGYLGIVRVLIQNDANPNILNRRKLTPFNVSSNSRVSEILLKSRSMLKQTETSAVNFDFVEEGTKNRVYAGDVPNSTQQMKAVEKMLKAIAQGDVNLACFYLGLQRNKLLDKPCHPLCSCGDCKGTAVTVKSKLGINACNSEGVTALHMAASHGSIDLAELLINNGASVNVQTRSKLVTPLMLACQNHKRNVLKFLLESGSNVDAQDYKGDTVLHMAINLDDKRTVELILNCNPSLDIKNHKGRTAIEEAESKMTLGILKLLKDKLSSV